MQWIHATRDCSALYNTTARVKQSRYWLNISDRLWSSIRIDIVHSIIPYRKDIMRRHRVGVGDVGKVHGGAWGSGDAAGGDDGG